MEWYHCTNWWPDVKERRGHSAIRCLRGYDCYDIVADISDIGAHNARRTRGRRYWGRVWGGGNASRRGRPKAAEIAADPRHSRRRYNDKIDQTRRRPPAHAPPNCWKSPCVGRGVWRVDIICTHGSGLTWPPRGPRDPFSHSSGVMWLLWPGWHDVWYSEACLARPSPLFSSGQNISF